jgi:hypothetical protein
MSNRLTDFIIKENYKKLKKLKEEILFRSRKEVEINGNGTSGYVIKEGSNKDKVLVILQQSLKRYEDRY